MPENGPNSVSGKSLCEGRNLPPFECFEVGCCRYDFISSACLSAVGEGTCIVEVALNAAAF
jgi:hypothetical protein